MIALDSRCETKADLSRLLSNSSVIDLNDGRPVARVFKGSTALRLRLMPAVTPADFSSRLTGYIDRLDSIGPPDVDFSSLHSDIPKWSRSSADGLSALLGRSGIGTLKITLGDEKMQQHNVLVSGAVGQGKSTLLLTLIYSLAWQYSPEELEMYLLDLKEGLSLAPLAPQPGIDPTFLPHAKVIGLDGDQGYGSAVLETLVNECSRRARLFRGRADNIARYRALDGSGKLPRIIVIVDEFHKLFSDDERATESALRSLQELSRQGRAYGVHMILASQTLSGIRPLLAQQDGIFSQFPIRLALKNSQAESRVVLDPQNPEAAKLRFRGELILNDNFGSRESNVIGVVANTEPEKMLQLRKDFCGRDNSGTGPAVFFGSLPATLTSQIPLLQRMRAGIGESRGEKCALVGLELSVESRGVGPRLSKSAGSHFAVLGNASAPSLEMSTAGEAIDECSGRSRAVGVLLCATIALALQHPSGDAEFLLLDALGQEAISSINLPEIVEILQYLACDAEIVAATNVAAVVGGLADRVSRRTEHDPHLYVVGLGLDRVSLTQGDPSAFGASAADGLRYFLQHGCSVNAHLLAWWASVAPYRSALGIEAAGQVQNLLLLGLHQEEIRDVMGPREEWVYRENRGLMSLSGESRSRIIVPMASPTAKELVALRGVQWDN